MQGREFPTGITDYKMYQVIPVKKIPVWNSRPICICLGKPCYLPVPQQISDRSGSVFGEKDEDYEAWFSDAQCDPDMVQ